jgi:hypothetical protein
VSVSMVVSNTLVSVSTVVTDRMVLLGETA